MTDLPAPGDPRVFPDAHSAAPQDARLYLLAAESLESPSRQRSDALDRDIRGHLAQRLAADGASLAALFAGAPSVAVTRHLWRELDAAWRDATVTGTTGLALIVFALPIVLVCGSEGATSEVVHAGILPEVEPLAAILRDCGLLGGSRNFALAPALVGADAIDLAKLAEIRAWQRLPDREAIEFSPRALAPSALIVAAGREGVHLRYLVGTAIARPEQMLFAEPRAAAWGGAFSRELSRQLTVGGMTTLALARAPQPPLPAVATGRVSQREVAAQVFATNAIRKLRGTVGEPEAVISAHRAPDAPGGGELRLSLSSTFSPRGAEGFRCPLYPLDRVDDVASMLVDLMADCRVTDVRVAPGIHADRDPATGLRLLFKPDTLPPVSAVH
jgi:hypothetical protein